MKHQEVLFKDMGTLRYKDAWDYQEQLLQENVAVKTALREAQDRGESFDAGRQTSNHLLFVEHPHVYTLGKSGHMEHVLLSEEHLAKRGIDFFRINRGGDITYHGPGQMVGYPIFDLERFYTDIGRYLRNIEEVVIRTLADYGLKGERSPGETGVWLDPFLKGRERKICAIGVRTSRWITMHGFALNVNTDLEYFNFIIPCGIQNKQVTSLQKELGTQLDMEAVKIRLRKNFEEVFEIRLRYRS
ncbi:lipoyl(octanoyl) transferase LipB [Niabella drilacis]|uniref:Octanoyltransferase n=1 Tax=Niabella drilacis (strain DSM 25811 / CCM 8410 / CCUG 62505 / LMG 26954 / E90) TaxID=1285928 RepID=A0A1G6M145_NIADE|nr:lipoyl(octanoyl) transferase LipB [Niabella drilacis]SDC49189.1 lipoyl(octanoyl) transferase [Niabella drilacis]